MDNQDLDFNADDYNSFYYTNEKYIKRMDDEYILSKITEKYPDFSNDKNENTIKQVFVAIVNDTKLIKDVSKQFEMTPHELFMVIYRKYSFIFNKCYTTKIKKMVKNKAYAKSGRKNHS